MKVVTQLLLALEENAFLLAGVLDAPNVVLESSDILSKSLYNTFSFSSDQF